MAHQPYSMRSASVSALASSASDARRRRFPEEKPFDYAPFRKSAEHYVWDAAAKASMHDYNLLDMSI